MSNLENQSQTLSLKQKNKLYLLTIQDDLGNILKVLTDTDYDSLWLVGTAESKSMRGYWTLFDKQGTAWRFVDGNFRPKISK